MSSLSVDFTATTLYCVESVRERVKLCKTFTHMKIFISTEPMVWVLIDTLGELIRTKLLNQFLSVVTYRFIKLTKTIPPKHIKATSVAHDFLHHWVLLYVHPKMVLSEIRSQFMSQFLTEIFRLIGTKNFYTKMYH